MLETIAHPEEVLLGHHGRYVAHRRKGTHVVRVVYEHEGPLVVVVTTYAPYAKRYFEGRGRYEDRLFEGR